MFFYDSIHEVCITVPCADDVKEGTLCTFDTENNAIKATHGFFPDGVVKYVRNGKATVQIHGLVTLPIENKAYCISGMVGIMTNGDATGLELEPDAPKHMVYHADNENGYATVFLG